MKKGPAIVGAVMAAAVLAAAAVVAAHGGLQPGLDFGPGQYYYTDLPGWERFFAVKGLAGSCPRFVYYLLFALWGLVMYRFWRWIDRH